MSVKTQHAFATDNGTPVTLAAGDSRFGGSIRQIMKVGATLDRPAGQPAAGGRERAPARARRHQP